MTGHTPWREIKHKGKKNQVRAIQIAVYDLTGEPLTSEVTGEITTAVSNVLKKHQTLAHTIVTE